MKELSKNIVSDIIIDLADRRGLSQEWDMIDKDIQNEIKQEWCEIIDGHLNQENNLDELETEKDHSNFLEQLLKALYGSGWEYLTISKANEIRKSLGGPE